MSLEFRPPRAESRLRLVALLLALVAVRLGAWAALLPPWAGFDEPFHQSLVYTWKDTSRWPAFPHAAFSDVLVGEMRRWPLPAAYRDIRPGPSNYETQQSPAYYVVAGALLRAFWRTSPIMDLYVLRYVNALLAFGAVVLLWLCSRLALDPDVAWIPLCVPAFVPGFGVAFARVSNDAASALLISAAVAAGIVVGGHRGLAAQAAATGLALWTKLYAAALLPGAAWNIVRSKGAPRLLLLSVLSVPVAALALFSWRLSGSLVPIQYNLRPAAASKATLPWIRDAWTIAKTHVWVSGMSFLVLPNALCLALVLALGAAGILTIRRWRNGDAAERMLLSRLATPLIFFGLALAYNCWRSFAYYGGGGATGGWYLWAMVLPESLFLAWGVARSPRAARFLPAALAFLLAVTVFGDLILFSEPAGHLRLAGTHVTAIKDLFGSWSSFAGSRPAAVVSAAVVAALVSWLLGTAVLVEVFAATRLVRLAGRTRVISSG